MASREEEEEQKVCNDYKPIKSTLDNKKLNTEYNPK